MEASNYNYGPATTTMYTSTISTLFNIINNSNYNYNTTNISNIATVTAWIMNLSTNINQTIVIWGDTKNNNKNEVIFTIIIVSCAALVIIVIAVCIFIVSKTFIDKKHKTRQVEAEAGEQIDRARARNDELEPDPNINIRLTCDTNDSDHDNNNNKRLGQLHKRERGESGGSNDSSEKAEDLYGEGEGGGAGWNMDSASDTSSPKGKMVKRKKISTSQKTSQFCIIHTVIFL